MSQKLLSGKNRRRVTRGTVRNQRAVAGLSIAAPTPLGAGNITGLGPLGFTVTLPPDPAGSGGAVPNLRVIAVVPIAAYTGHEQDPTYWSANGGFFIGAISVAEDSRTFTGAAPNTTYAVPYDVRDTTKSPIVRSGWAAAYTVTTDAVVGEDPAILTGVAVENIGATTAEGVWTSDKAGPYVWRAERTSDSVAVASGSGTATAGAQNRASIAGLLSSTSMRFEIDQQNADAEVTSASANFTTAASSGNSLTILNYPRTKFLIDTGAWLPTKLEIGNAPIVVTGTAGQPVQARLVPVGGGTPRAWLTIGTANGSADQLVGWYPMKKNSGEWLVEVRLQNFPSVTATAANSIVYGHRVAIWGQSEHAQWELLQSQMPAIETLYTKNMVLQLKKPWATGRRSKAALKIPGVAPDMTGMSVSGTTITFGTSFPVDTDVEDWDFDGYKVVNAGAKINRVVGCNFGERNGVALKGTDSYIEFNNITGYVRHLEYCTFQGWDGIPDTKGTGENCDDGAGAGAAIKFFSTGLGSSVVVASVWNIRRNRFLNMAADCIKFSGAEQDIGQIIEENYFGPPMTFGPSLLLPYNNSRVYTRGEAASTAFENYVKRVDGPAGVPPPAGDRVSPTDTEANSNAAWMWIDRHCDCVQFAMAKNGGRFRNNYIEWLTTSRNFGLNGGLYLRRNTGVDQRTAAFGLVEASFNIIDFTLDKAGSVIKVSSDAQPNWTIPNIRNNWLGKRRATGASQWLQSGSNTAFNWGGNRDFVTDALIPSASVSTGEAVDIAALPEPMDGRVLLVSHDHLLGAGAAGVTQNRISNALPVSPGIAAMVHALTCVTGEDWWEIDHHTRSGTDFRSFATNLASRPWADDLALHNAATWNGRAKTGALYASWYAAPGGLAVGYGEMWCAIFLGRKLDGSAVTLGETITVDANGPAGAGLTSTVINHHCGELYDWTYTKAIVPDAHRFVIDSGVAAMAFSETGSNVGNKRQASESMRLVQVNANLSQYFAPRTFPVNAYHTGFPYSTNDQVQDLGGTNHTDEPHGQRYVANEGQFLFARLTMYSIMQAAGLLPIDVPRFDQIARHTDGSVLRAGSSAGPVTTRRKKAGTALPTTSTHHTECQCWEYGSLPVNQALVKSDGRVYVYPRSGTLPTSGVTFGMGGASGVLVAPRDNLANLELDYPIVDFDLPFVPGVPVEQIPAALSGTHPTATFTVPA